MEADNKKIAVNTVVIYVKLIVSTFISLITSRYVLLSLGQSDFGLYSVVGSIIVFINIIGVAMYTTTRRYINIEMGKGESANLNKIFVVSLNIHIAFAVLFFIIAESIGIWYINNYLNVAPEKLADSHFVFQVSSIIACIGLINVPYQGLINAFQKFWQAAAIDIFVCVIKLLFVFLLFCYDGNKLRFYAFGMSVLTFISFILYHIACRMQWRKIIRYKFYWDKQLYKEILVFNNYTALGATSCLGRTQGANMLVNFFFGTMVNGAFAVAYQVQQFTGLFADNLSQASAPQITQAYSAKKYERAYSLCSKVARMTILIMACIVAPLYLAIEPLLALWLKIIPEGAPLYCRWILLVALISTFGGCLSTYVQAMGKVKWFQITGSIIEISLLPISYIYFKLGYPPETILIVLIFIIIVNLTRSFILLKKIDNFPSQRYIADTYPRPLMVIGIQFIIITIITNYTSVNSSMFITFIYAFVEFLGSVALCWYIGLRKSERTQMQTIIIHKIKNNKYQICQNH